MDATMNRRSALCQLGHHAVLRSCRPKRETVARLSRLRDRGWGW